MNPQIMRWVLAAGALALNIALLAQPETQPWFWTTRPIVPPLTHLPGTGERTLAPPAQTLSGASPDGRTLTRMLRSAVSGSADRQQAKALAKISALETHIASLEQRAHRERIAVQTQAADLMQLLGPRRLHALELHRALSSQAMGEAWVWADAADRVAAPSP